MRAKLKHPITKQPKDGWSYHQDGFTFTSAKKGSIEQLADISRIVENYRRYHNKEVGDPKQDIIDQICKANPDMCRWEDVPENYDKSPEALAKVSLSSLELMDKSVEHVDDTTKKKRSTTCISCKYNTPFLFDSETYNRILFLLTKGKEYDSDLGYCNHFMHDNRATVFLEGIVYNDLPEGCWCSKPKGEDK